jgi:transcriptional regulator with XRE-family HTH domain
MTTAWWAWVQRHLDEREWTHSDLARHARINRSIISRWREGAQPEVFTARALALALHKPLLEVLVAAELLTPEEAGVTGVTVLSVPQLSDDELLVELTARLRRARHGAEPGLRLTETTAEDLGGDGPPPPRENGPPTRARRPRSR